MTDPQRKALMRYWWPNACRSQGWRANDRTLRLQVISLAVTFVFGDVQEFLEVLGNYDQVWANPPASHPFRHLESASELNDKSDVDAVKTLLLMLADSLKGANEHGRPELGQGRRQRNVLADLIKCLSQYPLEKPMGMDGARAFVQEILNDKFNRGRKMTTMTVEDVDDRPRYVRNERTGEPEEKPSPKKQLLMTVNGRLNGKTGFRAQAKHSMHDMLTNVGLECACKQCVVAAMMRPPSPTGPIVPPLDVAPPNPAPDHEENPF